MPNYPNAVIKQKLTINENKLQTKKSKRPHDKKQLKPKSDIKEVKFFALGGLDESGKNCYVLEVNNEIFIINTGTKVPISSNYGIDTLIPDFNYLIENQNKIKGIFITDTKNESFSALPWLLMNIKNTNIYTTPFTKFLIEERISKYKIGHDRLKVIALTKKQKIGSIEVQPINVASSMPFSTGYNFKTDQGDFIFLVNFVLGKLVNSSIFGETNLNFIKKTASEKGILALALDSGRSNFKGKAIDRVSVTEVLEPIFAKANKNERIVVGAYNEEVVSLQEILYLAKKYNRPVIPYGRSCSQSLKLLSKMIDSNHLPFLEDYRKSNSINNAVILVTGQVERLYQRFLRITQYKDIYLKLKKTDNVIMIASAINGLEKMAAFTLDEISRQTRKIHDIFDADFYRFRPAHDDILEIVKTLNPNYFIPVQGLYRYLVKAKEIAKTAGLGYEKSIVLQNGKIAYFSDGKYITNLTKSQKKKIQTGEVIIDGFGVGDISSEVIQERKILARGGLIFIAILYNYKKGDIIGDIQVDFKGVVTKQNKPKTKELIEIIIKGQLNDMEKFDIYEIQQKIKRSVRKKIYKTFGKESMVITTFSFV